MTKRGPKAAYNFRHQIVTVVGDDVAEWLKRRQGEGDSYRSLSSVTREVLEAARRLEQVNGELVDGHLGRHVERPTRDIEDAEISAGVVTPE